MTGRARANGEGSLFAYRNGYAAYVWVTTPAGTRERRWIYGQDRDELHGRRIDLQKQARDVPVAAKVPTVATYLDYWLTEVVKPHLAPATAANYDMFARLYVVPGLGAKRLDKLTVRDVQTWLNKLRQTCQCCAQGKDAARPAKGRPNQKRRCCAVGSCCGQRSSERTCRDAWTVLRNVLSNAVREEILTRNVAALVRVSKPRPRKVKAWTVDEARQLLESARTDHDPRYVGYVLILVLGLRRGELLGLPWSGVDFDNAEITIGWQLQRIAGQLLHRQTKTEASDTILPLPDLCAAALHEHRQRQERWRADAGPAWHDDGLVLTTRYGRPIEPRNFHRDFKARCVKAGVRELPVHAMRRTCASLLVALDVHPCVAMQILRHSQIAVTMNVYSEVSSTETRAALKRLGESLGGTDDT
ncbi:MAG TPA: site-specific integrase [Mycobacteriales bacterium]|nr:site-specific integrase [Mycobacteriales bacterium]